MRGCWLGAVILCALACSGGSGGEGGGSQGTIRLKGEENISATVRLLEPVSDDAPEVLRLGEIVTESSFDPVSGHHEMTLNIFDSYQIEVAIGGVSVFKSLVFSEELLEGRGALELGFINAGSTLFTELSLTDGDVKGKWDELMSPYGVLDPYSGRRDLRLSNLLGQKNLVLSRRERQEMALDVLVARFWLRLQEAVEEGDAFLNLEGQSFAQIFEAMNSTVALAVTAGDADFPLFFAEVFGPYYSKYRPLSEHLENLDGVEHLVLSNALGFRFALSTSSIPELVGVDLASVGVLQRWNIWDEMESLLATMASGELLSEDPFGEGLKGFRAFDDRSTGARTSAGAFDENFGYDRHLEGAVVSLILLGGDGSAPTPLVTGIDLSPID